MGFRLSAITARRVSFVAMRSHPRPGDRPGMMPQRWPARSSCAWYRRAAARIGWLRLAAASASGHEPHDDEDGHRDQPDDEKRLERCEDPARDRDGKPDGEDSADVISIPDDPAHVLSMRSAPVASDGCAGRAGPGRNAVGRLAYLAGTALVTSPQHRARDDRQPLRCRDTSRSCANGNRCSVPEWSLRSGMLACSADRLLICAKPILIADTAVTGHFESAPGQRLRSLCSVQVPAGPTGEPRGRRRCNSWP